MKNTLAVLLIAAMCGCAFFTMKYAQSHVSSGAQVTLNRHSRHSPVKNRELHLTVSLPAVQIDPQEAPISSLLQSLTVIQAVLPLSSHQMLRTIRTARAERLLT